MIIKNCFHRLKSIKHIYPFIITLILTANLTIAEAQHFVGITAGYSKGRFMNFANDRDYDSNYRLKNGLSFSSFYEGRNDSISSFRVELNYKLQGADMEVENFAGHASFYKNLDYKIQLLNLNLLYSLLLIKKKALKMSLLIGPTVSYNLHTSSNGNGWEFYYQTQIKPNGEPVQVLTTRNWEKNELNSKDLSQVNFGWDMGLDFAFPVTNTMDLLFQHRYNILLTNIATQKELRHTALLTGYLSFGLRYNLHNYSHK